MKRLYALATVAATLAAPAVAQQQPLCGPMAELLPAFEEQYGETPLFTGLSASGFIMTIIANPESGTFSVFRVDTYGVACLLDIGQAGRIFKPEMPGEPL